MTAKKNFKRLVRARARKTGESYATALWHLLRQASKEHAMADPVPTLRRIEKPEYGFAISLPEHWQEEPPDPGNSPWEVARFRGTQPALPGLMRNCLVFRNPTRRGVDARTSARNNQPPLERAGFGNFRFHDAVIASRPGARIDFDQPTPSGIWSCRHYHLVLEEATFCVAFGTTQPDEDTALLDALAGSFELIGELAGAVARPLVEMSRRVVEKPEYGFAVEVPEGWLERPADVRGNQWEVARFVEQGDTRHSCAFSRRRRPDFTPDDVANETKESLERMGFQNFQLAPVTLAGQPAVRLDCEQRDAGRVWAARGFFVKVGDVHLGMHLTTAMPEQDGALFDHFERSFRLLATNGSS